MAHRMQITLSDEQYERLRERSSSTGSPIAELVRRAVDAELPGRLTTAERVDLLRRARGVWSDRGPEAYSEWGALRHDRAAGPA